MEKWGTVRAGTGVRGRTAHRLGGGTVPATVDGAVCGLGAARRAGGRLEAGGSETGGFGNNGSGAGRPGGRGAGRRADDTGAVGPAAGTEGRPHEPSDCGHHIMLACAARRAVLGRGLPETGARRRRDEDGRVGARVR